MQASIVRDMAISAERRGGLPTERAHVLRLREGRVSESPDVVAAEEPLEIRLSGEPVAVTMRTPGHDTELAVGFLIGEGIIRPGDVATVVECRSDEGDGGIADVKLRAGATPSAGWQRNFYATSSCGVCGKASIEAVRVASNPIPDGPAMSADVLLSLPESLQRAQRVFERTGGLHAAGLFEPSGELEVLREDVGRHNAVDKAIGRWAMDGRLPLASSTLLVSGRSSFEIMQKALVAGIPSVAAVSAPSSLAVRLD